MSTTNPAVNEIAQCMCGAVKIKVEGPLMFSHYCHCRSCGRARGMTPVHLVGVIGKPEVIEGKEHVKEVKGGGPMVHTNCGLCGTGILQAPTGAPFYAVFPTAFRIETAVEGSTVPSSLLPAYMQPDCHANYENRLTDSVDDLPKYKTFPAFAKDIPGAGVLMTNDGKLVEATAP